MSTVSVLLAQESTPRASQDSTGLLLFLVLAATGIVAAGVIALLVYLHFARRDKPRARGSSLGVDTSADSHEPLAAPPSVPPAHFSPPVPEPLRSSPVAASRDGKIFISYRRDDSGDVVGRIYDRLVQRFGKKQVFKDVDSIPLGVDFRKHLQQMVGSCDILLAVMGDEWLSVGGAAGRKPLEDTKDFVRIELEAALQREIPVIPVLVRGAGVPDENELPSSLSALAYRNGIAVRADPDFHRDMDRLIEGVESHLARQA